MFGNILVAFKFSTAGLYALEKSVDLALTHGAKLHVFHALDYQLQKRDETDPELLNICNEIDNRFEAELKPMFGGLETVSFDYFPADPALEVCKIAAAVPADLIIIGCHQPFEKISMGRIDYVGMTILEKAPCPVMLVPFTD